jgi:hypothetical protein
MSNTTVKRVIKNLEDHAKSLKDIGCTFFACEGYESGRIKSMCTCDRCQSIIISEREANRLKKLLKN